MMLSRLITVALLAGLPFSAMAADVEATADFNTFDAPIQTNVQTYNWTGPYVALSFGYLDADTSGAASVANDGGVVGLRAGYDYDFGDYVLGAAVQWDSANIDLDGATELEDVWRLGGRAGLDSGRNLYYFTAGWARANTSEAAIGDSDGYYAGLGYEVFVTDQITAGAEVLYHEFDDFDLDGLDAEATTVNLSVGFRF